MPKPNKNSKIYRAEIAKEYQVVYVAANSMNEAKQKLAVNEDVFQLSSDLFVISPNPELLSIKKVKEDCMQFFLKELKHLPG